MHVHLLCAGVCGTPRCQLQWVCPWGCAPGPSAWFPNKHVDRSAKASAEKKSGLPGSNHLGSKLTLSHEMEMLGCTVYVRFVGYFGQAGDDLKLVEALSLFLCQIIFVNPVLHVYAGCLQCSLKADL